MEKLISFIIIFLVLIGALATYKDNWFIVGATVIGSVIAGLYSYFRSKIDCLESSLSKLLSVVEEHIKNNSIHNSNFKTKE